MRRLSVLVAFAIALVLSALPAVREAVEAAPPPPELHYVPMSDGVEIAVRVAYPADYEVGAKYPAVMEIDGYAGAGGNGVAPPGFVFVSVSVRGTGCSGGELELFSDRSSLDGKEIIDNWLPTQPWFDGNAAITGHSYSGLTGFLVAAQTPENLRAVAVSGLIDDFYRGILFPGGVPNAGFPVFWGAAARPVSEHQGNQEELQSDGHCQQNYATHAGTDLVTAGALLDTYPNRTAGEDTWAIQQGLMNKISGIRVPIQIGQQYQDEQTGPRGGHVLWEHVAPDVPKRFVVSTGRHNPNDPTGTKREWLECWVRHEGHRGATSSKGTPCADVLDPAKRVLAFFESFGQDRLAPHVAADWPLPDTDWQRLHLRADGTLGSEPGDDGAVDYLSTGTGRHMTMDVGGLGPGGLAEVAYANGLPDTARFTLDFDRTTAIAGPLALTLWATVSAPDVDLYAEILDVDTATGDATFVQRGLLRASLRAVDEAASARVPSGPHAGEIYRAHHPFVEQQLLTPLEPTKFEIEIFPLGHVFRAGHQLVLQVHAPPLNDPISTYVYEPSPPAVVSILQDAEHRTSILVPFMSTLPPMRAQAPGCGEVVGEVCVTPAA